MSLPAHYEARRSVMFGKRLLAAVNDLRHLRSILSIVEFESPQRVRSPVVH